MTQRQGFTLPELLVVMAVVAVLIALLMPALRHARESARAVGCKVEIRQDGVLKSMVGTDTRYMLPVAEMPYCAKVNQGRFFFLNEMSPVATFWVWNAVLDKWAGEKPNPYRKMRKSVCPSFENSHLPPTAIGYYASYMWTMNLPHIDYGGHPNKRLRPIRYERIRPQALLAVDGPAYPRANDTFYYFYEARYSNGSGYREMSYRHLGSAHFLAHDGSVLSYTPEGVPEHRFRVY